AEAKTYFEYALHLDPSRSEAWLGLGKIAEGERRWADAVDAYEHAAKLLPADQALPGLIQKLRQVQTPYRFSDDPGDTLAMAKKRGIPVLYLFVSEEKRCHACPAYEKYLTSLEELR